MAEISPLAFPKLAATLSDAAQPPARAEAAKAAQRAFFQQALSQAQGVPPPRPRSEPAPAQAASAAPAAAATATASPSAPADPTGRYARPGSRLDIKV